MAAHACRVADDEHVNGDLSSFVQVRRWTGRDRGYGYCEHFQRLGKVYPKWVMGELSPRLELCCVNTGGLFDSFLRNTPTCPMTRLPSEPPWTLWVWLRAANNSSNNGWKAGAATISRRLEAFPAAASKACNR